MSDLRQDLQALIGPEEEWPDEVKEYMHARYVMLSQRREARDAIDVTFNARIEAAIAVPDAALLAVARMVKRGTCGECEHGGFRSCPIWMTYLYGTNVDWFSRDRDDMPDFGCTLFSPTEEPQP